MKKSFRHVLLSLLLSTCTILLCKAQTGAEMEQEEKKSFVQLIQEFPFSQTVYLQELREVQQTLQWEHIGAEGVPDNSLGYELEYGITEWFQLSLGYTQEYQEINRLGAGTGWFEAGTMVRLLNRPEQAATFMLEAEFPVKSADPELTDPEEEPAYMPMLIYARQWGRTQLHLNAGAELQVDKQEWFYNVAAVYGTGNWHPVLELNAESADEFNFFAGPGLVVNSEEGWELIAGIRRSLTDAEWGLSLKLLHEFTIGRK